MYRLGPGTWWYLEEARSLFLKSAILKEDDEGQEVKHWPAFLNHSTPASSLEWQTFTPLPFHHSASWGIWIRVQPRALKRCWILGSMSSGAIWNSEIPTALLGKQRLWQTQEFVQTLLLFDHLALRTLASAAYSEAENFNSFHHDKTKSTESQMCGCR